MPFKIKSLSGFAILLITCLGWSCHGPASNQESPQRQGQQGIVVEGEGASCTSGQCGGEGPCPRCEPFKACQKDSDCLSEFSTSPGSPPFRGLTCTDSVQVDSNPVSLGGKVCISAELYKAVKTLADASTQQISAGTTTGTGGVFKPCSQDNDCVSPATCTTSIQYNALNGRQTATWPNKTCMSEEVYQYLYNATLNNYFAAVAPEPILINPPNDAQNVPTDVQIIFGFNVALKPDSINNDTFKVIKKAALTGNSDESIPGVISPIPFTNDYNFKPNQALDNNAKIEVLVKGGPTGVLNALTNKDAGYTGMPSDVQFAFTIVAGTAVFVPIPEPVIPTLTFKVEQTSCGSHSADECDFFTETDCDDGYSEGQPVVTGSGFKAHLQQENVSYIYDSCGHLTIQNPPPQWDKTWKWVNPGGLTGATDLGGKHDCTLTIYSTDKSQTITKTYSYQCP